MYNCDSNAECTDIAGSYTCQCKPGYTGNGVTCNGVFGHMYLELSFIDFQSTTYHLLHLIPLQYYTSSKFFY